MQIDDTLRLDLLEAFPNITYSSILGWIMNDASGKGPFRTLREALDAAIETLQTEEHGSVQYTLCNDGSLGMLGYSYAIDFLRRIGRTDTADFYSCDEPIDESVGQKP